MSFTSPTLKHHCQVSGKLIYITHLYITPAQIRVQITDECYGYPKMYYSNTHFQQCTENSKIRVYVSVPFLLSNLNIQYLFRSTRSSVLVDAIISNFSVDEGLS